MTSTAAGHVRGPAISRATARRIALAAQGLGSRRPPAPPGTRQILTLVRRLGLLQLDSVNVFCRAHYMPLFSRLGPYDPGLLDRLAWHSPGRGTPMRGRRGERRLVEYWAHEASLIPVELYPLLRWRMEGVDRYAWGSVRRIARERPDLVAAVLDLVAREGPIRAGATGFTRSPAPEGAMWNWHDGKRALEYLFFSGQVAAAGRAGFERLYDLPSRVVPDRVLARGAELDEATAQRELVRVAARALGVAAEPDLGDYFRLPRSASKARVAELVAAGELLPVSVEGWRVPAYLWPEAHRPRRLLGRALLSPFDPLIWFRDRAQRLFDFTYRIEIYTPAVKRMYGYYVLPFLLGDRLVARVDLKSDRRPGVLRVRGAFAEPHADVKEVAAELAAELRLAAGWLGLATVEVDHRARGDLAPALRAALAAGAAAGACDRSGEAAA